MTNRSVIRFGGLCLAAGAAAFMSIFAYLAARFHYPEVLDGPASEVLPNLLSTGPAGRLAWAIYAFLPLIWLPAGVAAYEALAPVRGGAMRLALLFSVVAAMSMMLGLMRWPSVHWHLAQEFAQATRRSGPSSRPSSTVSTLTSATTSENSWASCPSAPSFC